MERTELTKVDRDLLDQMIHLLNDYEAGRVGLWSLVNGLDVAMTGLLFQDPKWRATFRDKWLVLEEANAVSLGEKVLTIPYQDAIVEAVGGLRNQISAVTTNEPRLDAIQSKIERVLNGDVSMTAAHELEAALLDAFPDDPRCQGLLEILASYRPGGGEFLFDETALKKECRWVLQKLRDESDGERD